MKQKHSIIHSLLAFVLVLSAFSFSLPAAAQEGDTAITFAPPTLEIGLGQVEKVDIVLNNASDIYALDLRGTFDPQAVEVVDMDPDQEGVQMVIGSFPKPDFVVRNTADNTAGTFMYVLTQVNPTPPASGTGVVLSIYFRGKVNGQLSRLAVSFVESADRRGNKLPVQSGESVLAGVAPKAPTPAANLVEPENPRSQQTEQPSPAAGAQLSVTQPHPTMVMSSSQPPSSSSNSQFLTLIALGGFGGAVVLFFAAIMTLLKKKNPPPGERVVNMVVSNE